MSLILGHDPLQGAMGAGGNAGAAAGGMGAAGGMPQPG